MVAVLHRFNLVRFVNLISIVFGVFALYLLSMVFIPKLSEAFAGVLLLLGFYSFKGLNAHLAGQPLTLPEKALLVSFTLYSLVSAVSFLYWPATDVSHMRVEDDIRFLLLIPLYFLFLRTGLISAQCLLVLFAVLALMMGLVSLGQFYNVDLITDFYHSATRPSAAVNPMRYAAVALIMVVFIVNALFVFKYPKARWILLVFAACLAIVACVLTQTRGVWLAIPVLSLCYAAYFSQYVSKKMVCMLLVSMCLLLAILTQMSFVKSRIDVTLDNIERYQENSDGRSSLGVRLDMYKASLILFHERPLWGHGLGVFKEKSKLLREAGLLGNNVHKQVGTRRTPHNEFFQALIERGLFGLLVTVLLFLIPAYIFYRALKSVSRRGRYYGLSGLGMLLVLFVAGQTGTLFNHNLFTNLYIIVILLFVSQIRLLEVPLKKKKLESLR